MNISDELRTIRFKLEDIDDVTTNPELKAKIAEILPLVREAYEIRKRELGREPVNNSRKPLLSGRDRNKESLNKVFNNRTAIKSSYVNCLGYDCLLVNPDFIDNHDLYFVDYEIDNDVVQYTIFHDDEDQYYAVKGEY